MLVLIFRINEKGLHKRIMIIVGRIQIPFLALASGQEYVKLL
jgi:hypothetical protein